MINYCPINFLFYICNYTAEGRGSPRVLFAGVVPRTFWIGIGGFVFFGAYEKAKKVISVVIWYVTMMKLSLQIDRYRGWLDCSELRANECKMFCVLFCTFGCFYYHQQHIVHMNSIKNHKSCSRSTTSSICISAAINLLMGTSFSILLPGDKQIQ